MSQRAHEPSFLSRFGSGFAGAAALTSLLLAGCPSDDASGDTDGETDTDSGTESTTAPSSTSTSTSGPTGSTTSTSTTDGTTTTATSTSSTTDSMTSSTTDPGSTETGEEESSSGGMGAGLCIGIDLAGYTSSVHIPENGPMPPISCDPAPDACGGDLVGTWEVEALCGYENLPDLFDGQCEGATQEVTDSAMVGTRTFNDDNTFDYDLLQTLDIEIGFDAMGCFGVDCETVGGILDMEEDVTAVCADEGGTCNCLLETEDTIQVSGTYAIDEMNNTVSLTIGGENQGPQPYCVEQNVFELWAPLFAATAYEQDCDDAEDCMDALGNVSEFYVCDIDEDK